MLRSRGMFMAALLMRATVLHVRDRGALITGRNGARRAFRHADRSDYPRSRATGGCLLAAARAGPGQMSPFTWV